MFSRGTVVACKACSGCLLFVFGVALAVLVAGSSIPSKLDEDSICGYTLYTQSDYRNATAADYPEGAEDPSMLGTYTLPVLAGVSQFNVLVVAIAALFWDWLWLTVVGLLAYWGVAGDASSSYFDAIERDHNWVRVDARARALSHRVDSTAGCNGAARTRSTSCWCS